MQEIISIIESHFKRFDDFIVGFADMKRLLENYSFQYGIVIGQRLENSIVDTIINAPTIEYYNHCKNVNKNLSELIHRIENFIILKGYKCKIVEPSDDNKTKSENSQQPLRTSISHKMVATRAGLGWIGKTDLLITKKFGPRLRLVSLLTDYPINQTGQAINKSKCGKCVKCISACPATAGNGRLWDIHTNRDVFFDVNKCRAKCVELTKKYLNLDSATCGICVSVCPMGMKNKKPACNEQFNESGGVDS